MKFGSATWQQNNLKSALLAFSHRGSVNLRLATVGGVLNLEGTAAAQLNAVVENRAGSQFVGSKAGAGIIHL
jgi:hypothetical protein